MVFLISLWILPYYIEGDQFHYRDVYKFCFYENYNFEQQFFCFQNNLGSVEPVYFFLSKFANSLLLSKDLFIAFANVILTFFIVLLIFKNYKMVWHRHVFIILLLTNYYFVVMLFAAERLKFGFIFLVLALIFSQRKRLVFFALSMLSHVQMAILLAPYFIKKVFSKETSIFLKIITVVGGVILFGGVFIFLQDHILSKYKAYSDSEEGNFGVMGALKTSIFIILAAISTRKIISIIAGLPMIVLAYFLGSERIGMLAFILYVALVLYYKKQADLLLFIAMLYFSYKSIGFILNIIAFGNGYSIS